MAPGYHRPVSERKSNRAVLPTHFLIYAGLSEALAKLEAQGRPMDAKAFRKAQKSTQDLGEGGSSGVTCGKYCLAFVCPCSIICSGRGAAVGTSKNNKLVGMEKVMDYVIACKNAPAHYHWSVQNYHYETHYSTDSEGNTTSHEVRVNTHFARTGGALVSTDATPPFRPNTTKSSVALKSFVDAAPDENFQQEYEGQKQMFYQSNRTDTHADYGAWYTVEGQKPTVHVAWVDHEDPWYATVCGRNCAALTPFTAVAWLKAINGYMGKQKVTFKKTCSGFAAPQRTPKNLRDIAAGR